MDILHVNIPQEIVPVMAHELIDVAGVRKAWELRATCTALKKAITDDIFLYQGKRVL
jgi:hypothetical protein